MQKTHLLFVAKVSSDESERNRNAEPQGEDGD